MEDSQIKKEILSILASQKLGVLATFGDEYPYTTIVAYAVADDLKSVLFVTIRNTQKYLNIQNNPNISMLVDNRSNRAMDFSNAQALTLLGKATEIFDDEKSKYMAIYLQRHPYLKDFAMNPDSALMKIQARKYILVRRFQEVIEFEVSGSSV
jgi:heme iron utilization protein